MTIEFHGGRLPPTPDKPRLRYGAFLAQTPTYPDAVDYLSKVANFPMYLNDRIGDCTFAGAGHIIQAESKYGQGTTHTVTDNAVLTGYEAVSGYNPQTGANDDGCVMQEVLSYWRNTGIGGHKILAFAEVDTGNVDELRSALNTFGALYIGFNFPASAMDQFNNGEPWDYVPGSPLKGGHAVHGGVYKVGDNWKVVTWGGVQDMTQAFWDEYVDEAWIVITPEWLNANGQSPSGFDLYGLGKELAALTGGVNPFPEPQPEPNPTPSPAPEPVPVPEPVVEDPDAVLQAFLTQWFDKGYSLHHHPHLEAVLRTWLQDRLDNPS